MVTRSNPFGDAKKISNPFGQPIQGEQASTTTSDVWPGSAKDPPKKAAASQPKQDNAPKLNSTASNLQSSNSEVENEELLKKEYEKLSKYNCLSYAIRPTSTKVPVTSDVYKDSNAPIGLTISPLTKFADVPIIKYDNDQEVPRCKSSSCRAYINPFCVWIEGGDKWICNICKSKNVTESYFYEGFNNSGDRKDRDTRPEISSGSYEFIANSAYITKDKALKRPTFIFVIDVSLACSNTGFLTSLIEGIKSSISELTEFENDTRVRKFK